MMYATNANSESCKCRRLSPTTTTLPATNCPALSQLKTPCWLFDLKTFSIPWSNQAGLELWQAKSIEQLAARDLRGEASIAIVRRLEQIQQAAENGESSSEYWTLYPGLTPTAALIYFHPYEMTEGRTVLLVEAQPANHARDTTTLRAAQALMHTSTMVSMYDTSGTLLYANPAALDMLGPERKQLADHFSNPEETSHILESVQRQRELDIDCNVNTTTGLARHKINIRISPDSVSGKQTLLLTEVDITQRFRDEQKIHSLAYNDSLTGLPNRTYLHQQLGQTLITAQDQGHHVGMLFIDLDRFKLVNDSLGHHVGDALLKHMANQLNSALRNNDTLVRLGGDEFVVIIDELEAPDKAESVAKRLLESVNKNANICGHDLSLSASIGVAVYPIDGTDTTTLMKNADVAMYHAKERGGNQFKRFDNALSCDLHRRLQLEVDLRKALDNQEFELYYQPRISSDDLTLARAEALIRWNHPTQGTISPAEFIPIAEETGMIIAIGDWVLQQAVQNCAMWQSSGFDFGVSVNVSSRQISQPDFVNLVKKKIRDHRLDPARLELELTESMLVNKSHNVRQTLTELHDLGVEIAIDDFGTGFSNLAYLKNFPIDKLKIDRSFIMQRDQRPLVETIVTLGKMLDVNLVAEGIETHENLAWLHSIGCDEYQGYLFARPLPLSEFMRFVRQHTAKPQYHGVQKQLQRAEAPSLS